MAHKALLLLVPAAAAAAVASQWREISRYFKVSQMSSGGGSGHPEKVPIEGVAAYATPGRGANDGTGEFDSGSRGGPADAPAGPRMPGADRRN
jgi:hypothetical protein